MKYIGNYGSWIPTGLIEYLDTKEGESVPLWNEEKYSSHPELEKYRELARPGYSQGNHCYQRFIHNSEDMKDFPKFDLPEFPEKRKQGFWWIVKLRPGQMQFIHVDQYLYGAINPLKYSMFLQDWQPGHIFVYGDKMISNYKAGDVYDWRDSMIEHGAVNIGFNNRYTLQISFDDGMYWPDKLK